jgi:hypothetical protein
LENEGGVSFPREALAYRQNRGTTMIDTIEIKEIEQAVYEVSDDALEHAADQRDSANTLGACTGLSACPA